MRTGLLIADFEMSFTTTFKHTAAVKWGVNFDNSNINPTVSNLQQLKQNIQNGKPNPGRVGYEITLQDVERVGELLNELLTRWKQHTNLTPPEKLYKFLQQLRAMDEQTPEQVLEQAIKQIATPKTTPNQTKKERKQAEIDAVKQKRMLDIVRKQNRKG